MHRIAMAVALCVCSALISVHPVEAQNTAMLSPDRLTLSNGLQVIMLRQSQLPLVALRLVFRTGSTEDPAGKEGLTAITASLLKKGAGERDAAEFVDAIDFHGGSINVDYSHDGVFLSASFLSRDVNLALMLLGDMVKRPHFSPEEVNRQRTQLLGAIDRTRERAGYLTNKFYRRLMYGSHPYSRQKLGTERGLNAVVAEDIRSYHQSHFVPGNAFLVVVGDLETDKLIREIDLQLGDWQDTDIIENPLPPVHFPDTRKILLVNKSDMNQAHVRVGSPGIKRNDPSYISIQIANTIFGGGGFTSRLVDEIRVNQGLTYDIASHFSSTVAPGTFTISSFTKTESTGALITAILAELDRLQLAGVTVDEVASSKQYLAGTFPLSLEGPNALAAQFAGMELFRVTEDYLRSYRRTLANTSPSDVQEAVQRSFFEHTYSIVVLGNSKAILPQLEQFGPVEIVDYRN